MVAEPKLERFFANLSDENFSVGEFSDNPGELEEILYYMDELKSRQITDALRAMSNEDYAGDYSPKNIIANLVKLYPLSQNIVHKILQDVPKSDHYFIEGFDVNERVYNALKHILKEAQTQNPSSTNRFQEYKKDVDKLAKDAEGLEQKAKEFQELRDQKRELEARVAALRRETDGEEIKKDIAELEDEERSLRRQKERQEEKKAELRSLIDNAKRELSEMQDNLESDEELNLIRELLEKFPIDAEESR